MRANKALKAFLVWTAAALILQAALAWSAAYARWHSDQLFPVVQRVRAVLLSWLPFSVGDVLYLLLALALIIAIVRWVAMLSRFRQQRRRLGRSVVRAGAFGAALYFAFLVGWGGSYYGQTLADRWGILPDTGGADEALRRFDSLLIVRLNALAPNYRPPSLEQTISHSRQLFKMQSVNPGLYQRIAVKASLLGHAVPLLGVSGYFNPWTGEGQVDRLQPAFDLPFVVCHEAAHQAGVAAESDANLLSYIVCTGSPDLSFQYSGYLNLWLYTHTRVRRRDSVLAKTMERTLHPLPLRHRDTLRARHRRYAGLAEAFTDVFYDRYLRLHRHPAGLGSYGLVALSAWTYEQRRPLRTRWYLP